MAIHLRRCTPCHWGALLLMLTATPGAFAAERFICEGAGGPPLATGIDTDGAARAIANTRSAQRPSLGIGYGRGGYGHGVGYGLGYGFDRFDIDNLAASSASANRELLRLIVDLQRQVDELARRVDAPLSLLCRPLSADEAQHLDSAPRAAPSSTPVPAGETRYARVDFVEVFNAPAAGARQVDTLRQGDAVQVFEQRDDWLRITPDGVLPGWVRSALLGSERP